ncbi:MAG: hypothetical protein F4W89_12245 [Acidobacteria bacterium]|nr:hypothetical protein [Acidobacteriota bacterium]
MKEITTTMTQRSQVTVPAEVRRVLGVRPRDKVTFAIADGEVRLKPVAYSLESAYGSVQPSRESENFDELSRAARDAKAEHALRKMSER